MQMIKSFSVSDSFCLSRLKSLNFLNHELESARVTLGMRSFLSPILASDSNLLLSNTPLSNWISTQIKTNF